MKISDLKYFINLILTLGWFDFKLKYSGSILGILWSLLKPFSMLIILYLVFANFLKIQTNYYHLQLLLGIIIWNFFVDTTRDSMSNFKAKSSILLNTTLPLFILPISTLYHSLITFLINFAVFFIFSIFSHLPLNFNIFYFLLLLVLLCLFNLGISFFTIPLYLRFSDFSHLWDIFLQLLFWLTPIPYTLASIPEKYLIFYNLNPLAQLITSFRHLIILNQPIENFVFNIIFIFLILVIGFLTFQKYIKKVIELI